eukprot:gene6647-10812_t
MSDFFTPLIKSKPLKGQVAIITGSSRGIGREVALVFAQAGCNVVITGKSDTKQKTLEGTIYTVAEECEKFGIKALPVKLNVRDVQSVNDMVEKVIKEFGRVDILINNAGALWWKKVKDTPMSKYDLINEVNSRGTFACTSAVLPYMLKQNSGRIINMSPPIDLKAVSGKVAYFISKFGMTLQVHGLADEVKDTNIGIYALWPATLIESFATKNFKMGDESIWRKASILSDCCLSLVTSKDKELSGKALIDEDYLRSIGMNDFKVYRKNPDIEPPRITIAQKMERGGKIPSKY